MAIVLAGKGAKLALAVRCETCAGGAQAVDTGGWCHVAFWGYAEH